MTFFLTQKGIQLNVSRKDDDGANERDNKMNGANETKTENSTLQPIYGSTTYATVWVCLQKGVRFFIMML